jgi:oligopeptide/dipeptide ABC transporter ATP-binding protein
VTAAPLLDVAGLSVGFPTASAGLSEALRDVSFSIEPGEIVGLVGESGAGKTVLARTIMGLTPAPGVVSSGRVWFKDTDVTALPEREMRRLRGRDIAMIVPNPRGELNPVLPVGEQIATIARIHLGLGRQEARHRALEMLRRVQIPDPERRMAAYPHEMSGGMAQRVVLAIALICEPAFLISDDATSGLDVTVQAQILKLMQALATERHSAMLFITRDVGVTAHLCDRVIVMFAGQVMEVAPREPFFLDPRHPYTVMLLAAYAHVPELRRQWAVEMPAGAPVPRHGCLYAVRCPLAKAHCRDETPVLREVAPAHHVRCHYPVTR